MKDDYLTYDLRSRFVKIMQNLHVDDGDLEPITIPNFTRIWGEVTSTSVKIPTTR